MRLAADIIMQLDDVVHTLTTGPRVEEAMFRSIRWFDRCINAHSRKSEQNLFPYYPRWSGFVIARKMYRRNG